VLIAAFLTNLLAKKDFSASVKSQLITIVLLLILWATGLTLGSKYLFEQVNNLNLTSTELSAGEAIVPNENSSVGSGKSDNGHFAQALNEYEKMIVSFENASKKEPLCQSDMMNMTLEMLPQLTAMGTEFEKMKSSGNDVTPEDLTKYLNLLNRFNKATIEMGSKVADPNC
jgi:hypothetical protein